MLRDLDRGVVRAVGVTPANVPEATVDRRPSPPTWPPAGAALGELHIDRAYLSSALVRERPADLASLLQGLAGPQGRRASPRPPSRSTGTGQRSAAPAGVAVPFAPGGTVRFPAETCAACPLRDRCTIPAARGRSVSIHPDERLLAELRERQQTPAGRAKLRERVAVEHTLAHLGPGRATAPATVGARKNLFATFSAYCVDAHLLVPFPDLFLQREACLFGDAAGSEVLWVYEGDEPVIA